MMEYILEDPNYETEVRDILNRIARPDVLKDLDDGFPFIEEAYRRKFSVSDAARYISLTSDELDEDASIKEMAAISAKYGSNGP